MQLIASKARILLPYLQGDLSLVSVIKLPEEGILTRVGGDLLLTWSRYGDNRSHDVLGWQVCTQQSTAAAGNRVNRKSHNQNHAVNRRAVTVPHRSAKPFDVVVKHGITR